MSPLDMRTIVLSYMVTNIVCVWFVVLLWRQNRNRFAGTAFWVVNFVFQAAALFLIVLRGTIPDWISMVLSNTLVIVGAILGFVGLERFVGKKSPQIHNYLLVILFVFVHSYFVLVQPNLAVRNLNIAVALLLVCCQSVWLAWRLVEPGLRSLIFGVGAVNFLYCLLSSVRIAHFFIAPPVDNNYFQPALFEALVLVSYQVLFIVLTYCFVLMVNKRLLMEIGTQEEKFSMAFQSAPYAITLTRPVDGKIIEVNESFFTITGYDRAEVLERNTTDLNLWENEEDRVAVVDALSRTGSVRGMELRFRKKNGEGVTGLFSAEILLIDGEKIILSSISDITERIRSEEEKRILVERLQRAEKMEALGILAGGVAHDLNNVLGIIVGYAELLLMDADASSSIRPRLVHIMGGGQRAAAMVQDLLTLARRGVSGRKVLNLNKIIAAGQQSPQFEKLYSYHPSVKVKVDLEPDLLNISGSFVHLDKTVFNLVSNACESMAKGGLVTIKTANQYLDKPIQGYNEVREGDYVVLSVSDTGEGIPEADLKRIFEPFYTKKVMGRSGTGLGLAVVWGTVKDHQGYIDVHSGEEKGSSFTLYFPVAREEITAEASSVPISEYLGKGESILVVDDVQGQRDLAAAMLKTLNYSVASVSSGEEAVAYLKERRVDLMVLDMIMEPGLDGLDTYKLVLEIHPQQKAIIVSGFSETDRVTAAQALGAGEYVRKPYVIEKLGLAVRKELNLQEMMNDE